MDLIFEINIACEKIMQKTGSIIWIVQFFAMKSVLKILKNSARLKGMKFAYQITYVCHFEE